MNPTPRPNPVLLALLAAAFAPQAFADNPADTPADSQNSPQAAAESAFTLGEITVRGRRDTAADESVVRAADIRRSNSRDIAQALATQPGVSIDFSGGRNETGIRVRGFDARQVPLFLDGIPQYVPYDGYVDFARFPTPGLAEIRTAKAGASLMYGFNTMGGAINLVTRKPQQAFEGSAQVGLDDSSGRNVSLNLGSATERFYVQGGFAYLHQSRFRLPKGFSDLKARPTDTGRYRENAGRTDRHYSLKFGLTPNETDEYALGYSGIRSEKQQPVYTGYAPNSQARYWRWPYWDKDSFYFIGNTALGQANRLKVRLYHDSYKNGMQSYTDSSYTTPTPPSAPTKTAPSARASTSPPPPSKTNSYSSATNTKPTATTTRKKKPASAMPPTSLPSNTKSTLPRNGGCAAVPTTSTSPPKNCPPATKKAKPTP